MLICRNAEGVHDQREVGKPCSNTKSSSQCDVTVFFKFWYCYSQTLTNASRKQPNVHRSAQKHLTRTNVLAMKDMNLMKMDFHVEVTTFEIGFE